jgi:hypothetical protein
VQRARCNILSLLQQGQLRHSHHSLHQVHLYARAARAVCSSLAAQASNPSTRRRFLPFFLNGQLMPPRQTVAPADAPDQPLSCLLYARAARHTNFERAARARSFYCSSHAKAGFELFTFSAHCRHGRRPDAGLFQGPRNLSLSIIYVAEPSVTQAQGCGNFG